MKNVLKIFWIRNIKTLFLNFSVSFKFYIKIRYFGHQSEKLKKELKSLLMKHFTDIDFKIIPINNFSIGSFFNYKDKLPKSMRSSIIYKFSCAQCASAYVGATTRALYMRMAEHSGTSYRTGIPLQNTINSSIRDHLHICPNSSINLDSFSIVGTSPNIADLFTLESIFIHIKT